MFPSRTRITNGRDIFPFDQLPSTYNPPGGILATANSRVTPDGYAYPVTLDWGPPYRNERIWKVLASKPKLSAADMLALQNDVYSTLDQELAQRFTYAIDHAAHPSHRLREAADLMRTWDGNVTIPSVAATHRGRDARCIMADDFEAAPGRRLEAVSMGIVVICSGADCHRTIATLASEPVQQLE